MIFQRTDENTLVVILSAAEAEKSGFSDTSPKTYDTERKRMLLYLLKRVIRETEYPEPYGKFYTEVYKKPKGNIEITFIKLEEKPPFFRPLIFSFTDASSLMNAAEHLSRRYALKIMKSDLYLLGYYYLLIYPLITPSVDLYSLLGEYAHFEGASRLRAAFIEEHGRPLERGRAIEKLSL